MVEIKRKDKDYKIGSFLARNVSRAHFGETFDTTTRTNPEALNLINRRALNNENLSLLIRTGTGGSDGLQLIHSLFVAEEEGEEVLLGFRGYKHFEDLVEIDTNVLTQSMPPIQKLKPRTQVGVLPTGESLWKTKESNKSVEDYIKSYSLGSLSNEAVKEAKLIPSGILVDGVTYEFLDKDEDTSAITMLKELQEADNLDLGAMSELDGLIQFLWATGGGYNTGSLGGGGKGNPVTKGVGGRVSCIGLLK